MLEEANKFIPPHPLKPPKTIKTNSKYSLLQLSQLSLITDMIPFLIIYAHCGFQESSEQHAIFGTAVIEGIHSLIIKTKGLCSIL